MFQSEILELLDTFNVKESGDFYRLPAGQQPYFIRRLYRAFIDNVASTVDEVKAVGGVKFHFRTSGDLSIANTNLPTEAFLKKTAFYANRTIVSFPFEEVTRAEQTRLLRNKPTSQWPSKRLQRNKPFLFGEIASDPRMAARGTVAVTGKVYTIDRAAFNERLDLLVAELAVVRREGAAVRVARPDRAVKMFERLPEAIVAQMRRVEDQPEAVDLAKQLAPFFGEASARIRPIGIHAGAIVRGADGAKSGGISPF